MGKLRHRAVQSNLPRIGIDHTEITKGEYPKSIYQVYQGENTGYQIPYSCMCMFVGGGT